MTVTVTYTSPSNKAPTLAYYAADRAAAAAWVAKQKQSVLNRNKTYTY
jgi:hypothetical protein